MPLRRDLQRGHQPGRSRLRSGTTMPSAATTSPSRSRTGTATEQAPRLISSTVVRVALAMHPAQLLAQPAGLGDRVRR